jgi:hypothetical protein
MRSKELDALIELAAKHVYDAIVGRNICSSYTTVYDACSLIRLATALENNNVERADSELKSLSPMYRKEIEPQILLIKSGIKQ